MHDAVETQIATLLASKYRMAGELRTVVNGLNRTLALQCGASAIAYVRLYRSDGRTEEHVGAEMEILSSLQETAHLGIARPIKTIGNEAYSRVDLQVEGLRYVGVFQAITGGKIDGSIDRYRQLGSALKDLHSQRLSQDLEEARVFKESNINLIRDYALHNLAILSSNAIAAIREVEAEDLTRGPFRDGIRHGDVNPNNVIVSEDRIHLIDFDDCDFGNQAFDIASMGFWLEYTVPVDAKSLFDAMLLGYGIQKDDTLITSLRPWFIHKQILTLRMLKEKCILPPAIWEDMVGRANAFIEKAVCGKLSILS